MSAAIPLLAATDVRIPDAGPPPEPEEGGFGAALGAELSRSQAVPEEPTSYGGTKPDPEAGSQRDPLEESPSRSDAGDAEAPAPRADSDVPAEVASQVVLATAAEGGRVAPGLAPLSQELPSAAQSPPQTLRTQAAPAEPDAPRASANEVPVASRELPLKGDATAVRVDRLPASKGEAAEAGEPVQVLERPDIERAETSTHENTRNAPRTLAETADLGSGTSPRRPIDESTDPTLRPARLASTAPGAESIRVGRPTVEDTPNGAPVAVTRPQQEPRDTNGIAQPRSADPRPVSEAIPVSQSSNTDLRPASQAIPVSQSSNTDLRPVSEAIPVSQSSNTDLRPASQAIPVTRSIGTDPRTISEAISVLRPIDTDSRRAPVAAPTGRRFDSEPRPSVDPVSVPDLRSVGRAGVGAGPFPVSQPSAPESGLPGLAADRFALAPADPGAQPSAIPAGVDAALGQSLDASAQPIGDSLSAELRPANNSPPAFAQAPAGSSAPESIPLHAEWLAARGGGTARLRLHPPELGELQLHVRVRGKDVEVVIAAQEGAARLVAQEHRDGLAQNLASRDLKMEQFEVRELPSRDTSSGRDGAREDAGGWARSEDERQPVRGQPAEFAQADRLPAAGVGRAVQPPGDTSVAAVDLRV